MFWCSFACRLEKLLPQPQQSIRTRLGSRTNPKDLSETAGRDETPTILIHDRDAKFCKQFVDTLASQGVRANALPKASPNLNGRCERDILTIKSECLSKFIIFGKQHLDHLLSDIIEYYNTIRSHMERDSLPPIRDVPDELETIKLDQVEVKEHRGGLISSCHRKAA